MKGKLTGIRRIKLNDGRVYEALSIGGKTYNLWDSEYIGKLKPGDTIDYEFTQSGKYKNIKKLAIVNAPPAESSEQKNPGKPINPLLRKDIEIVRMSCIKSALYITNDLIELNPDEKAEKTVEVARVFEKYVTDFDNFED